MDCIAAVGAQMQASETQNRAAESAGRRHERPSGA